MANMNHVILAGNLTGDPELTHTPRTGTPSVKMTIAVNRRRARGKESVAFVPLKALGKIAEVAHTYLQKGSGLMVEGRLETRSYEKDGQRRYFTEVLVNELQMLPKSSSGTEPSSASEDEIEDDQEIEDEPI